MKLLHLFKNNQKKLLPSGIILAVLVLAGTVSYLLAPQPVQVSKSETANKTVSYNAKPTEAAMPTPHITGSQQSVVLGSTISKTPSQPKATLQPTQTARNEVSNNTVAATNTPVPQQLNPTATPMPAAQTVSVEVKSPDGSSTFSVDYSEGMNACDILQKAKESGKIKSVTFDDSYMDTLHSKYISEINGFANNWTFTVNGTSPLGCSLSQPKPNDAIVWKFGA